MDAWGKSLQVTTAFTPAKDSALLVSIETIFANGTVIYFDFLGYSLIAVGLGKLFNIELTLNFARPYASVNVQNGKLIESGSRTIAVVGIADSISSAEQIAEKEVSAIGGPLFHRADIGTDALVQKRIDQMKLLR